MPRAIRRALEVFASNPNESFHVGLWLNKFLLDTAKESQIRNDGGDPSEVSESTYRQDLLRRVAQENIVIPLPNGYGSFVQRWRAALPKNSVRGSGKTLGRLVLGLGAMSPWENNITLHHTWGVPVIPGSALKGLCASYAHKMMEDPAQPGAWRRRLDDSTGASKKQQNAGGAWHNLLFGTQENEGCVFFQDALWSNTNRGHGLRMDIMTTHHPEYYRDQSGDVAPWEIEEPIPVPFLSVSGSFEFCLCAKTGYEDWARLAGEILQHALAEEGIGAKTSSGYGRIELKLASTK